jgi:hypothetical protein
MSVFEIKLDFSAGKLETVYSILSQPKRSTCTKSWKALLEKLSIEEAQDLPIAGPRVVSGLIGLLKSTQVKAVRDLLNG